MKKKIEEKEEGSRRYIIRFSFIFLKFKIIEIVVPNVEPINLIRFGYL